MRVAVTGGDGFLGRYAVQELERQGHCPVPLDLAQGWDCRNWHDVRASLRGCDAVIHLAGVLGTGELFDTPQLAVQVNVEGAVNVLEACAKHDLRYVGVEIHNHWRNLYQSTKAAARMIASAYRQHKGVPVTMVRPFNAYGAGQKLGPVQKLVPTFAHNAWRGVPMPIWGDGSQQVDLIWAGDVAKILAAGLQMPGADETIDAGTGLSVSILGVAYMVEKATGIPLNIEFHPMRPGEHIGEPPVSKGEGWDLLEWRPTFNAEAFQETVESYR